MVFDINAVLMICVFVIGYIFITFEHYTHINKATIALMMAILCWVLQFTNPSFTGESNQTCFGHHLANISQVVFFLLGALTIVEIISVHRGFDVITDMIHSRSKRQLLWVFGLLSFFLSSILDNLTTTVVMITLLQKMIDNGDNGNDKLLIGGAVVVAANAGGAWTPIGDVTTTMLWIGGQISTINTIKALFIPSVICLIVSLLFLTFMLSGEFNLKKVHFEEKASPPRGKFIFYLGVILLAFVPVFKILTGLPPFMGMLFGLSAMWLITDLLHFKHGDREHLRVPHILTRIDLSGTLFFLGILLCIDALETAKILESLASFLNTNIGNTTLIATAIGFASAIVDNVPLVAATMGMYDLATFPQDHELWQLIAFCAGTGGSMLLIGSAAGVVFMGMEKVDFFWYVKKITLPAAAGFIAGILIYLIGCTYCHF